MDLLLLSFCISYYIKASNYFKIVFIKMLMAILLILRTKQPHVEIYLCTGLALGERVIDYYWKAPSWGDSWSKAKQTGRDSR